ncbi:MAG: beta-lactamase family protein [Gammaproteobacteria bacterium]|nr:beta-lactamase family protein [Gammaproteobacteria bacterium]
MNKAAAKVIIGFLLCGAVPMLAQGKPMDADAAVHLVSSEMQSWVMSGKIMGGAAILYLDGNARILMAGHKVRGGAAPDARTMFSIGSITKVFTAAMLADLINSGKVKPSDPVDRYLPRYTHLRPKVRGKLTFERLATFTASLPDGTPARIKTPRRYFGKYLSHWRPRWPIGSKDKYSDQSYEILAYIVPRIAGTNYSNLLSDLITGPLDMPDTLPVVAIKPDKDRAESYSARGQPFRYHRDSWNGVGFLFSTPADMQNFLQACLGVKSGSARLQSALQLTWRPSFRMRTGAAQGYAWVVRTVETQSGTQTLISKNGATGGFFAFIIFDRENQAGVVFMTNRDQARSKHVGAIVERLGRHVLTGQ